MRCEFPEVTRCCFCFPLRLGLLVWAYIKMISTILLFIVTLITAIEIISRYIDDVPVHIYAFHIPVLLLMAADVVFHIIFIIGAHKKDYRKIRIFYRYSIFTFVIYLLGFILTVLLFFVDTYFLYALIFGMFQLGIFLWIIIIEFYILILVRSEILKLKRNSNFEFVNHAADPYPVKADIQNEEKLAY